MDINDLDISQTLYNVLGTDKVTAWIQLLCDDHLKEVCDRVEAELYLHIWAWMKEYEDDYSEIQNQLDDATEKKSDVETKLLLLTESHKKLVDRLNKIGLVWDTEEKKLDITEDSPIRKLEF